MKHPPLHFFEQTLESLEEWFVSRGRPKYRAGQVMEWVWQKKVHDPAKMSNLSKLERDMLAAEMTFLSGTTIAEQAASDGTRKLLIEWNDYSVSAPSGAETSQSAAPAGEASQSPATVSLPMLGAAAAGDTSRQTECVMIPSEDASGPRRTACISSQIGCPVGCRFCASGLGGLDGNLSAGRIIEQVYRLHILEGVNRISNIVFMGMGEPLSNFAAVTHAVRTLNAAWGPNISGRKITISTVGLPKAIERLAEQLEVPVTLALSLHAPTDDIRRRLIPWAEYTTIAELLAACQKWFEKTGREITLEYTLLHGVNDRPEHAEELARLAKTLRANINIIRYNEVKGLPFERPRTENVREFQRILRLRHINAHIRASRGRDIAAACGQLRHESAEGHTEGHAAGAGA
jgi:23S rRNA (adenine2503-C2)-methyltransferase